MKVEILNHSHNISTGDVLTTFLLSGFPKCLLAELNTHRVLSRNTESSRARPVSAVIKQVLKEPFTPIITVNQKGMSGKRMEGCKLKAAMWIVKQLRFPVVLAVICLNKIGVHKQNANRYLEPWMKVSVIVSGTEWGNFFKLRTDPAAQPEFKAFAEQMQYLYLNTEPILSVPGDVHKPWPMLSEIHNISKVASVSYANHGKSVDKETAHKKVDFLWDNQHLSPFEMVAIAAAPEEHVEGNYKGWHQLRHTYKTGEN